MKSQKERKSERKKERKKGLVNHDQVDFLYIISSNNAHIE